MKKSTFAVAVLVALGAVCTGGAWYTGTKAESEFGRVVEQSNQILKKQLLNLDINAEIKNVKFERGLFSSTTKYDVVFTNKEKEAMVLPFEGHLYHGPLPLNQLSKGNFKPLVFSSEDQMVKNEQSEPLFKLANGKKPFVSQLQLDYTKTAEIKYDVPLLEMVGQQDFDKLSIKGSRGETVLAKNGDARGSLHIDTIEMVGKLSAAEGENNDGVSIISFNGIDIASDLKHTEWDLLDQGTLTIDVDSVKATEQGKDETLEAKGLSFDYKLDKKDEFVDLAMNIKFKELANKDKVVPFDNQWQLGFNHLDGAALNELFHRLIARSQQGEDAETELTEREEALLKTIQQKAPNFVVGQVLKNDKGENNALLDFTLSNSDLAADLDQGKLLSLFSGLKFDANLDKESLLKFHSDLVELSNSEDKEEVLASGKANLESMIDAGVSSEILVKTEKGAKLNLILENGVLKLNDKEIPEEQVAMILFLAIMGMGSGMQ